MKIYGYVRVSTREQNEARQLIAMEEFGVTPENIYLDKQSGKDFDRPKYKRLLRLVNPLHIAGYGMEAEAFNDQVEACVYERYDLDKVKQIDAYEARAY